LDPSNTATPKKRKNEALASPESARKLKKMDKLKKNGLSDTVNDGYDQPHISHDTHRWVFRKEMKTQNNAREAVKIFKVAPRRTKRDEMIEDVEAKVNEKRLGMTDEARQYGDMISMG
jgi:hypothetical protein